VINDDGEKYEREAYHVLETRSAHASSPPEFLQAEEKHIT